MKEFSFEFQEKIMLGVTSVNECRYCSYFHIKIALENGCDEKELRSILENDYTCLDPYEIPAVAFGQHFAESSENPSSKAIKELLKFYGLNTTRQIILSCIMITIGNLFGNTIDAYQSRKMGKPPQDGSIILEWFVYYLSSKIVSKLAM